MIIFQLFEATQPFTGHDPVEAARNAAMLSARPGFPLRTKLNSTEVVRYRGGFPCFAIYIVRQHALCCRCVLLLRFRNLARNIKSFEPHFALTI